MRELEYKDKHIDSLLFITLKKLGDLENCGLEDIFCQTLIFGNLKLFKR